MTFVNGRKTIPIGEGVHTRASGAFHPLTGKGHRNNSPRVVSNRLPRNSWVPRSYFHFGPGEVKMEYDTTGNNLLARQTAFEGAFPQYTVLNLGTSFQGRTMKAYRMGPANRKHFVVLGGVHGNEVDGINGTFKAMELLATLPDFQPLRDEWTVFFVPAMNPDGWKAVTRNTAEVGPNGQTINLNRNFDWFWAEYVETANESKGSAPESTPEAQRLLNYYRTGNGGGPVPFGYLQDQHANVGVGARYQSRDRVWRTVANNVSTPLPTDTGYLSIYLDWYIWRMALAAAAVRVRDHGGPDYYVRYLRSRFRPHLHSYFSSQGVVSMATEEVKVAEALGRETFQTACNYRLDYVLAAAAACTSSFWSFEDGVLVEPAATNILTNSNFEQWQAGDVRPGNWTKTRASTTRFQNIPELSEQPINNRFFDDSGEAVLITSDVDITLSAASEFTRSAQDDFQSIIVSTPNTADVLQIKVGDNAFEGTLLALSLHTQRFGMAMAHGGTSAVDLIGGGTSAPSTGAVNNVRRITTSGTPAEASVGTINTARMFHAHADNFLSFPLAASKRTFLFGGYSSGAARLASIEIWNPNTNTSTNSGVALPAARADAVAVYYPVTNRVFIFGGSTDALPNGTTTILDYNVAGDSIATHGTTMSKALVHAAAAFSPFNNKIYIFGGQDTSGNMSRDIFSFDPATGVFATETVFQNLGDDENAEDANETGPWVTDIGRWSAVTLVESSTDDGSIYLPGGRMTNTVGALTANVYVFDAVDSIIGLSREADFGYFRFSTPAVDTKYTVEVLDDFTTLDEINTWEDPSGVWTGEGGAAVATSAGTLKLRNLPDFLNQEITMEISWQAAGTPAIDVFFRGTFSGGTLTDGYIVRYVGTGGAQEWSLVRKIASVETVVTTVSVSGDPNKHITDVPRILVAVIEERDPVRCRVTFNSLSIMDTYDTSTARIKATTGQVGVRRN